ncbi:MAG: hypothetical protein ACLGJD_26525, partial [Gammaproteobacteria bacterium]
EMPEGAGTLRMDADICEELAVVLRDSADKSLQLRQAHGAPFGVMQVMAEPPKLKSAVIGFREDGAFIIQMVSQDRRGTEFALSASQARNLAQAILQHLAEAEADRPSH